MLKILMSAYACEPGAGSEYGVGWMVPTTMARKYPEDQIFVLTRSRCKEKIEKAGAKYIVSTVSELENTLISLKNGKK